MEYVKPLKKRVSLSLDIDIVEKLKVLAAEDDRALSSCINIILRDYLRNLEKKEG